MIDLFAGIGGMRLGFEANGGRCLFTSEIDRWCRETYRANFPDSHKFVGDIRSVRVEDIPPHDVLLAGFPCQPFSLAGVSKKNSLGHNHGFMCKTQGAAFFEIAKILGTHRPAAFLLENVKNLLSHDGGRTFETIMEILEVRLGYQVTWRVFDAKGFVPQSRERVFIAGFRGPCGFDLKDLEVPDGSDAPKLRNILHETSDTRPEPPFTDSSPLRVNPRYTLSPKLWKYLKDYAAKHRAKGNGFGYGLFGPDDVTRTLSARYHKDGSEILVRQRGRRPRRLTPRECARLMGFDRPGAKSFSIAVSDTQAYRQFGNAVVVPLVSWIASEMRPYIEAFAEYEPNQQLLLPGILPITAAPAVAVQA